MATSWPVAANRIHRYAAFSLAAYAGIAVFFGWRGVAFALVQSVTAIFILELFNYVAHYGLVRRRAPEGRLEPLGPRIPGMSRIASTTACCSTAAATPTTTATPALDWQHLRLAGACRRCCPFGLAGSILLALIPPLWRRIMDRKVDDWMASPAGVAAPQGS